MVRAPTSAREIGSLSIRKTSHRSGWSFFLQETLLPSFLSQRYYTANSRGGTARHSRSRSSSRPAVVTVLVGSCTTAGIPI